MDTKPHCLGFIMDGNRRFAAEQKVSVFDGHRQGGEVFTTCVQWVRDNAIAHAVFYAFSTENWKRSEGEINNLMQLFRESLDQINQKINNDDVADNERVNIRVIGNRSDFAPDILDRIDTLEKSSATYKDDGTTIWIALSYGGRAEIVQAVNQAVANGEFLDEAGFASLLGSREMPDPDMIVRTGGEQRLSNFLPWQAVYSELYFITTHWPALTVDDFNGILSEYSRRVRRNGT